MKASSLVVGLIAALMPLGALFSQDFGGGGDGGFSGGSLGDAGQGPSGGVSSPGVGVIVGENYILKPSDIITVSVYQEPDLLKEVRVEGDGTVALALVGKVKIAGMTVAEAQALITELYNRDYIVNPQVSVLVTSFSPKVVHILGQVGSPGIVQIPPDRDLSLVEAIAAVRGVTRLGNPKAIVIKRIQEDGRAIQMEVNFNRIVTDPDSRDIILQEGDTIWVPERII